MANKTPVDLIMFDFDGTLADSLPAAIRSVQAMLKELRYPNKSAKQIRKYIGFGEIPLIEGSIGHADQKQLKLAIKVYYKHIRRSLGTIKLYPRIKNMLDYFKDKLLYVVSNKKDEFIQIVLKKHQIDNYFVKILGGDKSPCLKPDPCVINALLKKHGLPKQRALFVGDMTIDIKTGKNAGILTCATTYGLEKRKILKSLNPDFLVNDAASLIKLFD